MLGPIDYLIWFVSFSLEVYILFRAVTHKDFFRYLSLNLFIAVLIFRDLSMYAILKVYGFASPQYTHSYYYTDLLLTVMMYLAIMHLYHQTFSAMRIGKYIRGATVFLLAGTALFSYIIVRSSGLLDGRFIAELSQDLYFVGLVLTYLLWAAIFKMRETRARLVQLVLALGIYFSGTAALYAAKNMFPEFYPVISHLVPVLGGIFLPAAWAYTFSRVPEESRLVPQRLAEGLVTHR